MRLEDFCKPELALILSGLRKRDAALELIAQAAAPMIPGSDADHLLASLIDRETKTPTSTPEGVAFPHGRSLAVKQLTILFARCKDGVDFESEDGKPTKLFFLILAPPQDTGNYYLQALGKIAELVRKTDVREALMDAADFDAMVGILKEAS